MRILLIFPLLIILVGCQYDPNAHLYTTDIPEFTNVVGSYVLTSQTITRGGLEVLDGKICSIQFRADGTFIASNVPPRQEGFPAENFFDTLISGSGTWRIASVGSVKRGPKLLTCWGVDLDSPNAKFESVGLSGAKPPYGLIYTLGDPDSGEALILKRSE